MKKYRINIGIISVFAIIMFLFGIRNTVNGLVIRNNLKNIQITCDSANIKNGLFVETDLDVSRFLGNMLPTATGKHFFPLVGIDAVSGEMRLRKKSLLIMP